MRVTHLYHQKNPVMKREWFVFYRSFFEAAEDLSDEDRIEFYDKVIMYGIEWELPDMSEQNITNTLFKLVKPQLDANNKKFYNWSTGWRPKDTISQIWEDEQPLVLEKITTGFEKNNHWLKKNKPKEKEKEKENDKEERKGESIAEEQNEEKNSPQSLTYDKNFFINKMRDVEKRWNFYIEIWNTTVWKNDIMDEAVKKSLFTIIQNMWIDDFKKRCESFRDSRSMINSLWLSEYLYQSIQHYDIGKFLKYINLFADNPEIVIEKICKKEYTKQLKQKLHKNSETVVEKQQPPQITREDLEEWLKILKSKMKR